MLSDVLSCFPMFSAGLQLLCITTPCADIFSQDDVRCFHMFQRCFQMFSNVLQCSQLFSDVFRMSSIDHKYSTDYSIYSIFYILTYWNIFNHDVHCSAFGEAESLVLDKKGLVEEMDTLNRLAWTIFYSLRRTPSTVINVDGNGHYKQVEKNQFLSELSICRSYLLGLNDLETRREALNEAEAAKEVGAKSPLGSLPTQTLTKTSLGGASPLDGFQHTK